MCVSPHNTDGAEGREKVDDRNKEGPPGVSSFFCQFLMRRESLGLGDLGLVEVKSCRQTPDVPGI